MTGNLSEDEARALAATLKEHGATAKQASVVARHFDRPLRLSTNELDELRNKLRKSLRDVERDLIGPLRSLVKLEIVDIGEVNAETLSGQLTVPFVALRFEIDKQPGWLVWDCKTAIDAVEVALGAAEPGENVVRRLSPVERSTCLRLLGAAAKRLATSVGLTATTMSIAQDHEELGGWRQGGEKAELQRLSAHISMAALGGESTLKLFLPGVAPTPRTHGKLGPQAPLPAHLGAVSVELRARLGSANVPLAQLLKIETGDVIPLDRLVGEPLELCVEDQMCMHAMYGQSRGQLAVRVHDIQRPKGAA